MAYHGLADFLEQLAGAGELVRIAAEVDAELEIAEITRRLADSAGPAVLFERVRGLPHPVLTNLLGTPQRACRALGIVTLDELPQRIEAVAALHTPQNWFDRLKMAATDSGPEKLRPKTAKTGISQQVVHLGRDVNLAALPLLRAYPAEPHRSLTAGAILTSGRAQLEIGVSSASLAALDEQRLAIVADGRTPLARHLAEHAAEQQPVAVSVVLGGDPAALLATRWQLPASLDVYHLLGMLHGRPVELVKARTHDGLVPCEAEWVLEGFIEPGQTTADVALAGSGGHQLAVVPAAPVMQVTAITHRHRPIFPALVPGTTHGESAVLQKSRERLLLHSLRAAVPQLVDLSLPPWGGEAPLAFAAIEKQFPHQARQIAASLLGADALQTAHFVVLVDATVNVHDPLAVWTAIGANASPMRDIFYYDGPAMPRNLSPLAAPLVRHQVIDATTKLAAEQGAAPSIALDAGEAIRRQVTARWPEFRLDPPGA